MKASETKKNCYYIMEKPGYQPMFVRRNGKSFEYIGKVSQFPPLAVIPSLDSSVWIPLKDVPDGTEFTYVSGNI